ncbi:ABC transporter permease [Chondrinema litorale]|uniref:ABC transporter permease n=1 Tax=Chondrinema litorale TaxID=2994555 RepID=UPI0025426FD5|nr:ABC transporter permease [Chondrinema litorale]UZR96867.1 ABC transporter permease [Chondrinema litorale]
MFKNYLITAIRNLTRNKLITLISIFSLSIGMSIGLFLIAVINYQQNFDTFHQDFEQIYRITTLLKGNTQSQQIARSPFTLLPAAIESYPECKKGVRLFPHRQLNHISLSFNGKEVKANGVFADKTFLEIFDFKMIYGERDKSFSNPRSIVITQKAAQKFFDDKNPFGNVLTHKEFGDFVVSGVIDISNVKTHIDYDFYISTEALQSLITANKVEEDINNWSNYSQCYTYVLLEENADPEVLQGKISSLIPSETFENKNISSSFQLQKITNILPIKLLYDPFIGISASGILMYSIIAIVILVIGCFNYTNLSIVTLMERNKEVGIRKTMGARSNQIFIQFLTESILISLISLLLGSILMYYLSMHPKFSNLLKDIEVNLELCILFLLFSILVGVLAGLFPAIIFSQKSINNVFRSNNHTGSLQGINLRKMAMVSQFCFSLVFIILLFVMQFQTQYLIKADYGFDKSNIINLKLQNGDYHTIASQLEEHSLIEKVSATSTNLVSMGQNDLIKHIDQNKPIGFLSYFVDHNFIENMGLDLIAGQNFPTEASEQNEEYIIVNEKTLKTLNIGPTIEAIGKTLTINDTLKLQITGVLKDFNYLSLKHPIGQMGLRYSPKNFKFLNIKYRNNNNKADELEAYIEYIWNKNRKLEKQKVEYSFYEDELEENLSYPEDLSIIRIFSIAAMFISCIGLLGLVLYSSNARVKEIGIRKTFGANTTGLVLLLSKEFIYLLLLAGLIALPIGYFLGNLILTEFTYKITIGASILLFSFLTMFSLGIFTILSQTIRTALSNPVDSLRNE